MRIPEETVERIRQASDILEVINDFVSLKKRGSNYIACCPSGYQLHRPDTTILQDRPGYGGTCYSDFTMGKTVYVTAYNATGATNLAAWTASTSGAQAYAHVIDGFATQSPMLGCPRVRHLSAVSRCIALTSDPAANLSLRRPNLLKH